MPTIEIELIDQDFRGAIDRLLNAQTDLSPLMTTIAGHLAATTERAFESERDPSFGTPWAALSPPYLKRKLKQGFSKAKLERTGELKASIVAESGDDYAEVAVGAPYAIYHQLGTRKMPARPFLGIDDAGEEDIVQATLDYLHAALDDTK